MNRNVIIGVVIAVVIAISGGAYWYSTSKNDVVVVPTENLEVVDATAGEDIVYSGDICNLFTEEEAKVLLNATTVEQSVEEGVCSYVSVEPIAGITFQIEDISNPGVQTYIETLELIEGEDLKAVEIDGIDVAYWMGSTYQLHAIRGESVILVSTLLLDDDTTVQLESAVEVVKDILTRVD